jgi:hypothetical protein
MWSVTDTLQLLTIFVNADRETIKNISSGEVQPISSSSKAHESHDKVLSDGLPQDGEKSEDIEYEDLPGDDEVEALDSLAGSAPNSDDENDSHSERSLSKKSEGFEYPTDEEDGDDVASTTTNHIKTEPAGSERALSEYIDKGLSDPGTAPGSQPDVQATGTSRHCRSIACAVQFSHISSRAAHQNGAIVCRRFACYWLRKYAFIFYIILTRSHIVCRRWYCIIARPNAI